MNLERITIKTRNDDLYNPINRIMVLSKLSDFTKEYLCVNLDFSSQKINNGNSINALSFKNVVAFRALRPFIVVDEKAIVELIKLYGIVQDYDPKLNSGDYVQLNGLKFTNLGSVVNTYAQWNLPTPVLFRTSTINSDTKALFNSKLTNFDIISKINDNFQAGKYDADMTIPLIDSNDFKNDISVLETRPAIDEVNLMIASYEDEKNTNLTAFKDVFIDTIFRNRKSEIDKIKTNNPELYKSMQKLLLDVNVIINNKITGEVKPKSNNNDNPVDLSFLDDVDNAFDTSFLENIDDVF